ncbi:GDYXXLXY domain-containing protein [Rhizobium halophytocola]|uniref:Membrane-anchored protein n=1 Tax=Rhizobium halophytocola TaxID=735519 RepID=A0ABS4DW24_9HYPH|nr:GDYXXLXY domain-containing protein [Rhizobium halophytocola]MBP1849882.1 putative membrane-anchored protein [Rhizobium halophytocola]
MTGVVNRGNLFAALCGAILISAVMTAILGGQIGRRAAILSQGSQVLLSIRPVDPRDLLRGEYVALSPDIDRVPADLVKDKPSDAGGQQVLRVRLKPTAEGETWQIAEAAFDRLEPQDGTVVIESLPFDPPRETAGSARDYHVRYGIERFYLPEGEGPRVEAAARAKPLMLGVRVDDAGRAQVESLFIDGEPVYTVGSE